MKRYLIILLPIFLTVITCCKKNTNELSFEQLQSAFQQVPDSIKLATYWYWISDHISEEGVVQDLQAMKQAGINRAFIGNIGLDDTPYGESKIMSDEWWKVLHKALKTATELDIEIGIFNSPGWSQSGGPWITPQQSMRYLSSATIDISGPIKYSDSLPLAGDDAQDVKVLAYPLGDKPENIIKRVAKKESIPLTIDIDASGEHPMRSLTIKPTGQIVTSAELFYKEKESQKYLSLRNISIDRSNLSNQVGFDSLAPIVIGLPEIVSNSYRLQFDTTGSGVMDISLSSEAKLERYPEKSLAKMFQGYLPMWDDYMWDEQPVNEGKVIKLTEVVDITDYFKNQLLEWDVPEGNWRIVRLAMCPTGVTNSPASPEGKGLEVDKMNKTHLEAHFDAFIGEIIRRIPAQDRSTFKIVVQDSYETGSQNWSDGMLERFEERYGYSAIPYLPVLQGTIVGSVDHSDRFLWDLRRLIADGISYDYVGALRDLSHQHGLTTWLENYGHWGYPGEFLQYGGQSDEVAGEFWSEGSLGDIENKAASSCAHIYGKRKVWAESFTSGGPIYSRYPYLMKQRGDRFFTEGINSTLLHLFIHQPYEDRLPGMTAWFGNEFNRNNTWFSQADLFFGYLKRVNFMLQQGQYQADVAYFIGEDVPKMTGVCDPKLPKGYSFDYINAEVLLNYASAKDGKLILESGMEYKVLVMPKQVTIRPEVFSKIEELVRDGVVLLGEAPERSPSLENYPIADTQIQAIADKMWADANPDGSTKYGKGSVFGNGNSLEQIFEKIDLIPDCTFDEAGANIEFIHRKLPEGEIYFLSNQQESTVEFTAKFRNTKGVPQIWDPLTGEIRTLPQFNIGNRSTKIPLQLEPFGSAFIIFRNDIKMISNDKENFPSPQIAEKIDSLWNVEFKDMWGETTSMTFDSLIDWAQREEVKYFSGTARYKTQFNLKEIYKGNIYIDLGRVMVMAKVTVNGQYAGGVWTYPYRVNVTELVQEGENTIEVEVVNNWMNRLIGDFRLPQEERRSWASTNQWAGWMEPQSSGLLGPVTVQVFNY